MQPAEQRAERDDQFLASERRADAVVPADAEREVFAGLRAPEIDPRGVSELRLVAVCGTEPQAQQVAGAQRDAAELGVGGHAPEHALRR